MGGSDQLFGIGALLVLETRPERIRSLSEHAGLGGKIAVAGATSAAPNRFRLADHVTSPCYGVFRTLSNFISSLVRIVTMVVTPTALTLQCRPAVFAAAYRLPQRSRWSLRERSRKSRPRPFLPAARCCSRCKPRWPALRSSAASDNRGNCFVRR